jgi:peptidoglycan/LPS O-acetylase OafA/YrhL
MSMSDAPHSAKSANLDLLRAIAVVLVFVDHLLLKLRLDHVWKIDTSGLGHFGVLLFFVHTSLVLMYSLGRSGLAGTRLFTNFYIRRIFRIYPLSILAVLATAGLHLSSAGGHGLVSSPAPPIGQLLANLFLVQNLTYRESILGVLWSLPLEVQMYLLLPLIFVWIRHSGKTKAFWWIIATWLGWVVLSQLWLGSHSFGRLNLLRFVPNFLGGVVAFVFSTVVGVKRRIGAFLWPVFIMLLVAVFMLFPSVPVGWLLCLTLGLGIPLFAEINLKWLNWISNRVANYSYGIYLSHSFCFWFALSVLAPHSMFLKVSALVLSAVGIPVLLYHAVEHPLIKIGATVAAKWPLGRPAERRATTGEVARTPPLALEAPAAAQTDESVSVIEPDGPSLMSSR